MQKLDVEQKSPFGETAIAVWEDERYYAAAFPDQGAIRLSVYKKDGQGGMTWDELREVKCACGYGDRDALEFYPAEPDIINTGPIRHLYIVEGKLPLVRRAA